MKITNIFYSSVLSLSVFLNASFSAVAQEEPKTYGPQLYCVSYGIAYAKQFAEEAAKALQAKGVKNFRVKASLKSDGTRGTTSLTQSLLPAGALSVAEKQQDCKSKAGNALVCKTGYEVTLNGALVSGILPCELPKILTISVKADKSTYTTTQKITLPGVFVYKLNSDANSRHEVVK